MNLENVKWSSVLDGLSTIATVFNPAIGSGLLVASKVSDSLQGLNDDELENNVIGLTRSAEILDDMIENDKVDFDTLKMISENLRSLEIVVSKLQKVLK